MRAREWVLCFIPLLYVHPRIRIRQTQQLSLPKTHEDQYNGATQEIHVHILLIEDDTTLAGLLVTYFERYGHTVDHTVDGNAGLEALLRTRYDIAVIDWMLPERSGLDICVVARIANIKTGLILLTARGDIDDRISGLRNGADDYVTKPFDFVELAARMQAVVRRIGSHPEELSAHGVHIDLRHRSVTVAGDPVTVTETEFGLLELLIRNRGVALSRQQIHAVVWQDAAEVQLSAVDVYVSYLRKKLHPAGHTYIETVRGYGYRWRQ